MMLRSYSFRAEGLDYSDELIDRLRREYPEVGWTASDIRCMPYAGGTFDGVISLGVVEHDEAGPRAALLEIRRVLRPCGIGIITVPRDFPRHRLVSAKHFPPSDGGAFFQYFMTAEELAEEMRAAGFQPIALGSLHAPSLDLLLPAVSTRVPRKIRAACALAVNLLFRWTRRYDGMIYCVGRVES